MRRNGHNFEFTIDMPRSIVWIAFAESELMSGWWGEAQLDAREGGLFRLELGLPDGVLVVDGLVERIIEPDVLELSAPVWGTLCFTLGEVAGGTRGSSTVLTVAVDTYPVSGHSDSSAAAVRARWNAHINDLVALLHGHPVDWEAVTGERSTGS